MNISCGRIGLKTGFAVVVLAAIGSVLVGYFNVNLRVRGLRKILRYRQQKHAVFEGSTKKAIVHVHKFDMRGNDIMVFLHIQKTGGTKFGLQLVNNLDIERPCWSSRPKRSENRNTPFTKVSHIKRIWHCFRPGSSNIWLFSRHHLGWPCGLHADWTEYKECVPKYMNKREGRNNQRKFFYVTIIREPVSRFLSEYSFSVNNNSTWVAASLRCNGRSPTKKELPPCFVEKNLRDITIDEFMGCPWNLATNRQTRMLADLRLVNCYRRKGMSVLKRRKIMLQSAMENLKKMTYFALTEYQKESQYLFEKTLGLKFFTPFTQASENETRAGELLPALNNSVLDQIKVLNSLDVELYAFAKKLFFDRIAYFKETDRINNETRNY